MATDQTYGHITLPAAADFSTTGQYRFFTVNTSGQAALSSAAGRVDGVVYDDPAAAGRDCQCVTGGVVKVEAGGTITAGDEIDAGASGVAVSGSTQPVGVALDSGVSGDIIRVLLGRNIT